jgi:hypothetical protein
MILQPRDTFGFVYLAQMTRTESSLMTWLIPNNAGLTVSPRKALMWA